MKNKMIIVKKMIDGWGGAKKIRKLPEHERARIGKILAVATGRENAEKACERRIGEIREEEYGKLKGQEINFRTNISYCEEHIKSSKASRLYNCVSDYEKKLGETHERLRKCISEIENFEGKDGLDRKRVGKFMLRTILRHAECYDIDTLTKLAKRSGFEENEIKDALLDFAGWRIEEAVERYCACADCLSIPSVIIAEYGTVVESKKILGNYMYWNAGKKPYAVEDIDRIFYTALSRIGFAKLIIEEKITEEELMGFIKQEFKKIRPKVDRHRIRGIVKKLYGYEDESEFSDEDYSKQLKRIRKKNKYGRLLAGARIARELKDRPKQEKNCAEKAAWGAYKRSGVDAALEVYKEFPVIAEEMIRILKDDGGEPSLLEAEKINLEIMKKELENRIRKARQKER